jgi:ubiquinone/menaquinone biosynthesis C-methylase UbiE
MESLYNFVRRLENKWLVYARHFYWGDRLDGRFFLAKQLKNVHNEKVLDLGCNAGIVLSEIDPSNFTIGLDLSMEALNIAQTVSGKSKFLCADMLNLPFKEELFDSVVFLGMLELPEKGKKGNAIKEIHRILKRGGKLFLTTQNRFYLRRKINKNYLNYSEVKSLLFNQFNFKILGFNPFPSFPYFIPNRILSKIPFIWELLILLMKIKIFTKVSCSFIVYGEKI